MKTISASDKKYRLVLVKENKEEEKTLAPLSVDYGTFLREGIETISRNELLKLMSFLGIPLFYPIQNKDFEDEIDTGEESPLSIPLTFENPETLSEKKENYEEKMNKIMEETIKPLKDVRSEIEGGYSFMVFNTCKKIATDQQYLQKVFRKNQDETEEVFEEEFKEGMDEKESNIEEILEKFIGKAEENIREFRKLHRLSNILFTIGGMLERDPEKVERVFKRGMYDMDAKETDYKASDIVESLSKLEDSKIITDVKISSICSNEECEYYSQNFYHFRDILTECPTCNSRLYQEVSFEPTPKFLNCVFHGLLPEIVTGKVLHETDWVEDVYVHKKIQQMKNGEATSAIEVDDIVITEDNDLLLFEVTCSRDYNEGRVINKISRLEDEGIYFDGFFQISPTRRDKPFEEGEKGMSFPLYYINNLDYLKEKIDEVIK